MIRPAPAAAPIHYPSSDGRPMAENDAQRSAIMYGIGALARHFRDRPDVYVSGDLLIYYEEGNPRVSIAPDVFVVFGAEKRQRLNYKLWEERHAPAFVLEVASPSTWRDDVGRKRSVYARLGVREYCRYDPGGRSPAGAARRRTPDGVGLRPSTGVDGARRHVDAGQRDAGAGAAGGAGARTALPRPGDGRRPAQPRRGSRGPPGRGRRPPGRGRRPPGRGRRPPGRGRRPPGRRRKSPGRPGAGGRTGGAPPRAARLIRTTPTSTRPGNSSTDDWHGTCTSSRVNAWTWRGRRRVW